MWFSYKIFAVLTIPCAKSDSTMGIQTSSKCVTDKYAINSTKQPFNLKLGIGVTKDYKYNKDMQTKQLS